MPNATQNNLYYVYALFYDNCQELSRHKMKVPYSEQSTAISRVRLICFLTEVTSSRWTRSTKKVMKAVNHPRKNCVPRYRGNRSSCIACLAAILLARYTVNDVIQLIQVNTAANRASDQGLKMISTSGTCLQDKWRA
jgi:hypothetical protein